MSASWQALRPSAMTQGETHTNGSTMNHLTQSRHTRLFAAMAVALTLVCGPLTADAQVSSSGAPGATDTTSAEADASAFDRADRRSRSIIAQMLCTRQSSALRRQGAFGSPDAAGSTLHCAVIDDRYVAVTFDVDTVQSVVQRLAAVELALSTRRTEPLDTARIVAVDRASRTALSQASAQFTQEQRQFATYKHRFDGDSIEVWFVPAAVLNGQTLTVGGERGYIFSPDGAMLARIVDESAHMRRLAWPDSGLITITSLSRVVPSMTELLMANLLNRNGREVAIQTQTQVATLVGQGSDAVWLFVARTP